MAEAGIVALDPVRLARLEGYLASLADGCRRGIGSVVDDLAGTGEDSSEAVGGLERVADWSRIQAEGVAWRRAIVEALPTSLPRPDLRFASSSVATGQGASLAGELERVLADDPPAWPALRLVLDEIARGTHSSAFVEGLRQDLGPEVLLQLPGLIARSHQGSGIRPDGASGDHDAVVAQEVVRDLCAGATAPAGGDERVTLLWRAVAGMGVEIDATGIAEIERAVQDAGLTVDAGKAVVGAVRALALGADSLPGLGRLGAAGLVLDIAHVIDDPTAKEALDLLSSSLTAVAPLFGGAAPVVFAAGAVAAIVGFAWGKPLDLDDDDRDVKRYDPYTGTNRYPGGSRTNPNVGVAGGPNNFA